MGLTEWQCENCGETVQRPHEPNICPTCRENWEGHEVTSGSGSEDTDTSAGAAGVDRQAIRDNIERPDLPFWTKWTVGICIVGGVAFLLMTPNASIASAFGTVAGWLLLFGAVRYAQVRYREDKKLTERINAEVENRETESSNAT